MYQNYHCNVILDELVKHIKSQKCCKETNRGKSLYNNREACIYIDKKLDIKVLYFDKYFAIIFSAIFISCYLIYSAISLAINSSNHTTKRFIFVIC